MQQHSDMMHQYEKSVMEKLPIKKLPEAVIMHIERDRKFLNCVTEKSQCPTDLLDAKYHVMLQNWHETNKSPALKTILHLIHG